MSNGVLVSRLAIQQREPEITILNDSWDKEQSKAKAASVVGINKLKAIQDFIHSNGRI